MSDTLVLHTTYQQTCCAALRGSQPSQPLICLHIEQPAHSSLHQLLNYWNGPLPDMRLVVIIVFFKEAWTEKIGTVYMFMSEAEVIC